MKQPFRSSRYSSFTIVELLVVMGIIAILAAVLLAAGNNALQKAQRVKAQGLVSNIQGACMAYNTEYGVYPVPSTNTADVVYGPTTTDLSNWENLIWALCGNVNPYAPTTTVTPTVSNTRTISFLSLRTSDIDSNGVPLNPITPTAATNKYFNIAIDGDYNGILSNVPNFNVASVPTTNIIAAGVDVWGDCRPSTSVTNAADWVHAP